MDHTYMVQYKAIGELPKWHDDASFPTAKEAIEYAASEASMCYEHEHRVVRAELVTLATFNAMGHEDYTNE